MCVVVEEEQERVEQGKEEQCTQQIVDQCYNSYVTTYKDVVKEKCDEVFVKTCRIVLKDRAFNATTRVCKRPLVKECNDYLPSYSNTYGAPSEAERPEPQIVCRNLYETQCNTTHQVRQWCWEGKRGKRPDNRLNSRCLSVGDPLCQ